MDEVLNVSITDFFNRFSPEEILGTKLAVIEINGTDMQKENTPVRLDAISFVVAAKGEMTTEIDYLPYKIKKGMVLLLVDHRIISHVSFSHDFKGYHVLIAKELVRDIMRRINEVPSANGGPLNTRPVLTLQETDMSVLLDHIGRIRAGIADTGHMFYKHVIQNELSTFILQFLNIRAKNMEGLAEMQKIGHKEEIAIQFINLLIENYREQHEVTFYSNELCITSEYLSRIMKEVSGKTVSKWIADVLVSEAKILLRKPDITVQQVAEELNFSDQSYFGKFFKKHTGRGPLEYRNSFLK